MSQKKTILKISICVLLALVLGFGSGVWYINSRPSPEIDKGIPKELLEKEVKKVDSLENIIQGLDETIALLKDSVEVVEIRIPYEVNKVMELPVDEAAEFLTIKLREHDKNKESH